MPIAAEVDESDHVSPELMRILSEVSLLRYCVPEEYGGYGIKVVLLCIIREELARVSTQADTNFIMQGLGSYPITLGGTLEQKARYLPPIAKGEAIPAFALTEPSGGSDVIGVKTSGYPGHFPNHRGGCGCGYGSGRIRGRPGLRPGAHHVWASS